MKNIFLFLLGAIGSIGATAQITIPSSTLPALGDTLRYAWAYNQGTFAMVTPPGFDQSWNFAGLTPNALFDEIYRAPGQGQFAAKFPTADLLVIDSVGERYYQVNSSGLYLLGYTEKNLFGYPFNVVYRNNPIFKERFVPLNFFDIYQQSTNNLEGFRFVDLPAGLKAAYLAAGFTTMDSIRLRVAISKLFTVDAYGVAVVPGPAPQPQYPVLRQKTTQYREIRVDGKVAPLGWLDITDLTRQYVPGSNATLGVDTTGSHIFYNDLTKAAIALLTLDAEGRPVHVRYKNNAPAVCTTIDSRPQNIWTGSAGNTWENPANWSCGAVPGANTDVFINSGTVVINSTVVVRSVKVNPGVNLSVASGTITILH